jgi:hypothetical protein
VDAVVKQTLYGTQFSAQIGQKLEGALITGISKILLQLSGHVAYLKETRNA